MDSSRELRAMILASFPCPPLPVEGHDRFINSHDMLAYLIDVAARRDCSSENRIREATQRVLVSEYHIGLRKCENANDLWNAMTMFTRQYMMSYCPVMHELRFSTFDSITLPLRHQICSWLAAQYILRGNVAACGDQFMHLDPCELYLACQNIFCDANALSGMPDSDVFQDGSSLELDVVEAAETDQGKE